MKLYLLFIYFFSIFLFFCDKKIIQEEDPILIKPELITNKKLQITSFINVTNEKSLDIYSKIMSEFIREKLSKITKIKLNNQRILKNKKKILAAYIKFKKEKNEKFKKIFKNNENLIKQLSNNKKKDSQQEKNQVNEILKKIKKLKKENQVLKRYFKLYETYQTKLKPYLGININQSFELLSQISDFTVEQNIFDLQDKNTFLNLTSAFEKLHNKSADFFMLGLLKKNGSKIDIEIKLYDKNNIKFIFQKKISLSLQEINLNIEKHIEKIANYYIKKLTEFPSGKLIVKSDPDGAEVFLNKKSIGKTTIKKSFPIGSHNLEILKSDYNKISTNIFISKNKILNLKYSLNKQTELSTLTINSNPQKADVFIDLEYKGKTPLTIKNLKPSHYKIRLDKKGYKIAYKVVSIDNKNKKQIFIHLNKGQSKYENVNDLSLNFNIAKNIFFYSTFVSSSAMLYSFLKMDYYSQQPNNNLFKEKLIPAKTVRTISIISTITSLVLTTIFQLLELYTEDIQVGFIPKNKENSLLLQNKNF